MDIIVDKVNQLCSKNIYIRFADNMTRESRVFPHFCSADGMEIAAITICPTSECPSCTCPADELDNTEEEYPCRPSTHVKEKVSKARKAFLDDLENIKSGCKEQVSDAYVVTLYMMSYVVYDIEYDIINNIDKNMVSAYKWQVKQVERELKHKFVQRMHFINAWISIL